MEVLLPLFIPLLFYTSPFRPFRHLRHLEGTTSFEKNDFPSRVNCITGVSGAVHNPFMDFFLHGFPFHDWAVLKSGKPSVTFGQRGETQQPRTCRPVLAKAPSGFPPGAFCLFKASAFPCSHNPCKIQKQNSARLKLDDIHRQGYPCRRGRAHPHDTLQNSLWKMAWLTSMLGGKRLKFMLNRKGRQEYHDRI